MVNTTYDLLKEFKCNTGYTHSDEITLIFDKGDHIRNGNVTEIITLISGYCSVRFNYHFIE